MSYTPLLNSLQIYEQWFNASSINPNNYNLLTSTFLNYITNLNPNLLIKNVNYKVVSYNDTTNQQLALFFLSQEQALTFSVPSNYDVSGTRYFGIPLAGVAINSAVNYPGVTFNNTNTTSTGFSNIVQEAVILNGNQIFDAKSVVIFNPYGFNGKNLFDIQDTLSSYVLNSYSTLGVPKQIIVGLLI